MDTKYSVFVLEVKVYYFGIVVDACTGAQKDYNLGLVLMLLKEVKQKIHFLESIFHYYIGIV